MVFPPTPPTDSPEVSSPNILSKHNGTAIENSPNISSLIIKKNTDTDANSASYQVYRHSVIPALSTCVKFSEGALYKDPPRNLFQAETENVQKTDTHLIPDQPLRQEYTYCEDSHRKKRHADCRKWLRITEHHRKWCRTKVSLALFS